MDAVWRTDPTLIHRSREHVTADNLVRTGVYYFFL